ncbi:MAG: hypothetical protein ACRDH6_00280 [Actinomycetota bacterium]
MLRRAAAAALSIAVPLLPAPVRAADQEAAWTPTLPVRPQTQQHLDLFADGTAYAYSDDDNIVYASSDYGLTWTARTTAPGLDASVAFGTPRLGYAAIFGSEFLMTDDGAQSWRGATGPGTRDDQVLYEALDTTEQGRVVVVGGSLLVENQAGGACEDEQVVIWSSGDSGESWNATQLPFYGSVLKIDMLDGRHGVAIIYDRFTPTGSSCESSTNGVWVTHDAFRTMQRAYDCVDQEICTAATMASPRRILVGTNNADLYLSTNAGRGFRHVGRFTGPYDAADEPFFWIGGLGFASERVGYMSTKGGGTWRTDDGGLTWIQERSTEQVWGVGIGDLAVADPDHAIAGGPNFVISRMPEAPS